MEKINVITPDDPRYIATLKKLKANSQNLNPAHADVFDVTPYERDNRRFNNLFTHFPGAFLREQIIAGEDPFKDVGMGEFSYEDPKTGLIIPHSLGDLYRTIDLYLAAFCDIEVVESLPNRLKDLDKSQMASPDLQVIKTSEYKLWTIYKDTESAIAGLFTCFRDDLTI